MLAPPWRWPRPNLAFSTGDNEAGLLPASLADSLVFTKPYRIADVEQSLRRMVAQRGSERG